MSQETEKPSGSDYDGLVKFVSWTPFVAGTVLLVLVVAYIVTFYQNGWAKDPDAWGQLGDYIGGLLNPLVAGFALLALVASVRLQKAELAATRAELKETKIALEAQAKTAEQQRSEQRFFDLFVIYKEMANDFSIGSSQHKTFGKKAIASFEYIQVPEDYLYFLIGSEYCYQKYKDKGMIKSMGLDKGGKSANELWCDFVSDKKPYIRLIFYIFDYLEELLADYHWNYGKLFRAQLGSGEIAISALSLLFDEKGKAMRHLAAKYGLLKNLPTNALRTYAEQELDPLCFGRKWAAAHPAMPSEETQPC